MVPPSHESVVRVLRYDEIVPGTSQTALNQMVASEALLEEFEALEIIEKRMEALQAAVTTQQEQRRLNSLIRRWFATIPECRFDKVHKKQLGMLLGGSSVGVWFRVREWLHRPIHDLFHAPKKPH